MTFANPIALWLLSSLAVPVAIHLLSRKEGRVIRVGSIRHLQESSTRQFKSIRLNELMLLLLRCALLTLVVVLLAGPACTRTASSERWLILEAGIEETSALRTLIDSLQQDGFQTHAMHEFVSEPADYRVLANVLRETSASCIVIAHNYLSGFSGKQEPLPAHIRWISIDPADTTFTWYLTHAHDSLLVREGKSSGEATSLETRYSPATTTPMINKPLSVGILTAGADVDKKRIIIAALRSIQWQYPGLIEYRELSSYVGEKHDWLINMTDSPFIDTSRTIIQLSTKSQPVNLMRTGKKTWQLNRDMREAQAREQNLPVQLLSTLTSGITFPAADRRTIPTELAWRGQTEASTPALATTSADVPLLILILVVLIIERTLSFFRKQ